uniref:Uncharacterized protein n=1 Tax=viral metagenome TaxID=1070528 RepID=A0A6C0BDA5_9ZZZZ
MRKVNNHNVNCSEGSFFSILKSKELEHKIKSHICEIIDANNYSELEFFILVQSIMVTFLKFLEKNTKEKNNEDEFHNYIESIPFLTERKCKVERRKFNRFQKEKKRERILGKNSMMRIQQEKRKSLKSKSKMNRVSGFDLKQRIIYDGADDHSGFEEDFQEWIKKFVEAISEK